MYRRKLGLYLLLWSAGAAGLHGNPKCVQEATPVKLPLVRTWRVALGCAGPEQQTGPEGPAPRTGIERAWRSYVDGDTLASRVELGKWLPDLLEHGETADVALALSVAKLAAAASSPAPEQAMATSLADDLTQARAEVARGTEPGLVGGSVRWGGGGEAEGDRGGRAELDCGRECKGRAIAGARACLPGAGAACCQPQFREGRAGQSPSGGTRIWLRRGRARRGGGADSADHGILSVAQRGEGRFRRRGRGVLLPEAGTRRWSGRESPGGQRWRGSVRRSGEGRPGMGAR